ncbi:hypothetical protein TELCIR_22153 [Teladorsagia circumcincta]|uniref:Uncharacterized protein n=1 Tax=Teladorsagia circumcincta TaxID=45464 RepID=A0A2G9TEZ2_TELCI|nr:hypothetical protein TELCIR_22153 [Teladorsagia circumcincta]
MSRYGFVVPLVIYCHNKKYKTELERLKMKVLAENRPGPSDEKDRETKKSHHVDVYSDMFVI